MIRLTTLYDRMTGVVFAVLFLLSCALDLVLPVLALAWDVVTWRLRRWYGR